MINLIQLFPNLEGNEMLYIQQIIKNMDDNTVMMFANAYNSRRKEPQMILLFALIGFVGISGVHRFVLNQVGMGVLFFFTGGLCLVGTIIDLINYKKMTFEFNQRVAREVASFMRLSN
jgi:TM2 domain-containing membrane protein YozV